MKPRAAVVALLLTVFFVWIGWANHYDDPLPANVRVDLLVVEKSRHQLTLYEGGKALKTYRVALGRVPVGAKSRAGDRRTPEGRYTIDYRNASSDYFRALHISYPARADSEAAARDGADQGGDVTIHGLRNGFGWVGKLHQISDWTLGCVAVTNEELEESRWSCPMARPLS